MGEYNYNELDRKWQAYWKQERTFNKEEGSTKPKYYVLDMFAYPSGEGLHVGHPLGYIATDIFAKYKKLRGFNVFHPMGFDAFGLPAEQFAIETGRHPEEVTRENIDRYLKQLNIISLGYDDTTNIGTCDKEYYAWTQWIFLKLFNSWYDSEKQQAQPINALASLFETEGNLKVKGHTDDSTEKFTAEQWAQFSDKEKSDALMNYRLMYITESMGNWCPELGTMLANDEVVNGVSERGGHEIVRKAMRQWCMRMTAYSDRLLEGLEGLQWPDPMKEMQRNWIGRSDGASMNFKMSDSDEIIEVFTTRPDTIFGCTFMVVAPEHEVLDTIEQSEELQEYIRKATNKSELERKSNVKTVSGCFTGLYCDHPFTGKKLPVWTSEYVLIGYGTGAIMAVPAHDGRDFDFAKHFELPIISVIESNQNADEEVVESKTGILTNSDFLNGLEVVDAIQKAIKHTEETGKGTGKVNYRLRDPNFSRQRYWGEPIPIIFKDDIPHEISESELPLELPWLDDIMPTTSGESPLLNAKDWIQYSENEVRENHTMPGYAGSSWYFYRYLDPTNKEVFIDKDLEKHWMNVDLYVGGPEHAVGHLLYARFWCKFLYDMGEVAHDEPFQKLINQGMIQGRSSLVYRIRGTQKFVSEGLKNQHETDELHVHIKLVKNDVLDIKGFREWKPEFKEAEFILEDGQYKCGNAIQKMSKRWFNVVNPDHMCENYGADAYRLYEMFLGPIEESKPFTEHGVEGVARFLKKVWNLFHDQDNNLDLTDEEPTLEELRLVHQTIKKVEEDIERFSLNTVVSAFMILANELTRLKCRKKEVLIPFVKILAPYAPAIAEELCEKLALSNSVFTTEWPEWDEQYIVEDVHQYPVQINGKVRTNVELSLTLDKDEVEKQVMELERVIAYTTDKTVRKFIYVPGKIISIVVN